jgi:hypothetical protein
MRLFCSRSMTGEGQLLSTCSQSLLQSLMEISIIERSKVCCTLFFDLVEQIMAHAL